MATRELTGPPQILPLYLRTAATLIPGAARLPGLPGSGGAMPDLQLILRDVPIDPARVAEYREVCEWPSTVAVPSTYVHVLAFGLHMALMADGAFPFSAVGLVHVDNEIVQLRPLAVKDRLTFNVSVTPLESHPRGRTFAILTTAHADGELVWTERSTMLRRGSGGASKPRSSGDDEAAADTHDDVITRQEWRVPEDTGRRYGAVSGDRNPIHLHALSARAFGFPRAIAHGMWTKARCLGAIAGELPDAYAVSVTFRKPVLLPARVSFEADRSAEIIDFTLNSHGAKSEAVHLTGRVSPHDSPAGLQTKSAAKKPAAKTEGATKRASTRAATPKAPAKPKAKTAGPRS